MLDKITGYFTSIVITSLIKNNLTELVKRLHGYKLTLSAVLIVLTVAANYVSPAIVAIIAPILEVLNNSDTAYLTKEQMALVVPIILGIIAQIDRLRKVIQGVPTKPTIVIKKEDLKMVLDEKGEVHQAIKK